MKFNKNILVLSIIVVVILIGALFYFRVFNNSLTNVELAKKSINFVDKLSFNNEDGKVGFYSVMNCDGTTKGETGVATLVWSFLAKSAIYDVTQNEDYIKEIREIENEIYSKIESRIIYDDPHKVLVTMIHPLMMSYDLLKNKNVLGDEQRFKKDIKEIVLNYVDYNWVNEINDDTKYAYVQDTAMMSVGVYDSLKLFKESEEEQEKINNIISVGDLLNKRSLEISQKSPKKQFGVKCWLLWSDYYQDKSLGKDISKYETILLEQRFIDGLKSTELMTANSIQPCMEVMLDLYQESKNDVMLDTFNEYHNLYFSETVQKDSTCSDSTQYAIRNKYGDESGDFFLSDNAYQIYLITRPEIKMEKLK